MMRRSLFKKEINVSLQRKTLSVFTLLLLFFISVFLLSAIIITKRSNDDIRNSTAKTSVNNVNSYISSSLKEYNYASRLIMVNDKVVHFLRAKAADKSMSYEARMGIYEITNMYSDISHIDSVYVIRLDRDYANTGKGEYIIDDKSPEKQRIIDARGSAVFAINCNGYIQKTDGVPMLTLSRAIYDISSQELVGILVMNIDASGFEEVLNIQQSSGMCIVDDNGHFLCGDADLSTYFDPSFVSEGLVQRVGYKGSRTIVCGSSSVEPLVIMYLGGHVRKALPLETIYALLLTLGAFILSIVILILFISRNITRPISQLDAAMERTKSSGWMERIDEDMPDNEIGRLSKSYNSMLDYLNELFIRLLEEEKNNQKAEMRVLQEQIKPHFLYNTLATISYLALEAKADNVADALETLGSFYRNFLSKGEREIPLRREIKISQDYLSLQKLRYGDIFTDEYDLDEDTLDCMVPKLILQPLVENSIYHGVRPKGEPCVIRISTKKTDSGISIKVYDSGVGMTKEQIDEVMLPSVEDSENMLSGFGLHGTLNRIRYFCDKEDVVCIRSVTGEFTEFELNLPWIGNYERKNDVQSNDNR